MDVGTGYYVEKSGAEAQAFFKAKCKKLDENKGDLEKLVSDKVANMNIVKEVLKKKIQEQRTLMEKQQNQKQNDEKK